ncbi:MAG: hypothetical protein AAB866_02340 [Patescibacteria group bacterium]
MKKSVLFALVLISILYLHTLSANVGDACTSNSNCSSGEVCAVNDTCTEDTSSDSSDVSISSDDETAKINKAYACLDEKIDEKKCSDLTLEQKIFSYLATARCKTELMSDSSNEECWPKSSCSIKDTAQAALALSQRSSASKKAGDWLISQNTTPSDLVWFLQIETTHASSCDISYESSTFSIRIDEDKKISGSAGSCLSIAQDGYWLRISSNCYDQEFKVKCHESDFLINLLFKKETSSTIHVSERTQFGLAEEEKSEKVNSFCFSTENSCDYEGSLWAVMALSDMNYNIDPYIPYLITMMEGNEQFLPESFLWAVTGYDDFKTTLLSKQKPDGYWMESDDKFYDTALALFPITADPMQKKNAKDWLLKVQDADGCWLDNIRNTAFILASVWGPENLEGDSEPTVNYCADNRCMASPDCQDAGGDVLADYVCNAGLKCCSVAAVEKTCEQLKGDVCSSNEQCSENEVSSSDGLCCTGKCNEKEVVVYTCASEGNGECKTSCGTGEEGIAGYTCEFSDVCCSKKTGGSSLWIWILVILIILVIVAIIFRDKLRPYWFRFKSKFGKKPSSPTRPSGIFPTNPSRTIPQGMTQRRIIPSTPGRPRPTPGARISGEFDEVLRKLKEMGK